MRKLIITSIILFCTIMFTSCDSYAQVIYEDDFEYVYSYNTYPVHYTNGVYYYYVPYGYSWRWVVLDRVYYPRVVHHPRPLRYIHPRPYNWNYYYNTRPPRPYNPGSQYRRYSSERRNQPGHMRHSPRLK